MIFRQFWSWETEELKWKQNWNVNLKQHWNQCFRQTVPLQEYRIAFREDPQKKGERANLTLYFYKADAGLT